MKDSADQSSEGSNGRFHILQPLRDLESNWGVDLAKNLEEYLLKICSGEITGEGDDQLSVNFAEAALVLQGSIQVYSRKVEYLYSLVLVALSFISQNRHQDQPENTSVQPDGVDSHMVCDEENELFLGLDDVQVEAKNCLDDGPCNEDEVLHHFVKPPSNLVVLEGDCLDVTGDAGELESYLLATSDLYQDFLLLDPSDAVAINDFLEGDQPGKQKNIPNRGSSLKSKGRKGFLSPTRQSGGAPNKSSFVQTQDVNNSQDPGVDINAEVNFDNVFPEPPTCDAFVGNDEMDGGYSVHMDDDDDDDDPWKPLNPHDPGNLKIKPFKKVKPVRRKETSSTRVSLTAQFPLARLQGTIDSEFAEIWEAHIHAQEKLLGSQSPPLYEKLRQSLVLGGLITNSFSSSENDDEDDNHDKSDFEEADINMPETTYFDPEIPLCDKEGDAAARFDNNEAYGVDDSNSLQDLCRAHLDALLASIAANEQQSELASRVSSWKQRIEQNLEEQNSHAPFDIHEYGEKVMGKLSLEADSGEGISFMDIVRGQEKHDVARTFSALLQLVNNGDVDLDRGDSGGEPVCHTAENPFYVRPVGHDNRRERVKLCSLRKRVRSPLRKVHVKKKGDEPAGKQHPESSSSALEFASSVKSSTSSEKFSVKLERVNRVRCTPEGKKRRKPQFESS